MKKIVSGVTIECTTGDIASQEGFDGVVNAANAQLRPGGGVAGALHRGAGTGLDEECRPLAPIKPGEAVITGGHNLPNSHVIHCLGPVYGVDEPSDKLLASCYKNALILAEENNLRSVAFPSLSTGAFGYPMEEAAKVAFRAILEMIPELQCVKTIRFTLYGNEALEIHEKTLTFLVSKIENGWK